MFLCVSAYDTDRKDLLRLSVSVSFSGTQESRFITSTESWLSGPDRPNDRFQKHTVPNVG